MLASSGPLVLGASGPGRSPVQMQKTYAQRPGDCHIAPQLSPRQGRDACTRLRRRSAVPASVALLPLDAERPSQMVGQDRVVVRGQRMHRGVHRTAIQRAPTVLIDGADLVGHDDVRVQLRVTSTGIVVGVDLARLRGHRVSSAFSSAPIARLSADRAARSSASTSTRRGTGSARSTNEPTPCRVSTRPSSPAPGRPRPRRSHLCQRQTRRTTRQREG
jgi:hypothetical protein